MLSNLTVGVSTLLMTYVFLYFLQQFTHDAKEPPTIANEIPFISPLLGMAKQMKFYISARDKYNLPIYTLRLPWGRIYVINSTKLIGVAQHHARTLDFAVITSRAAIKVMCATPAGQDIINMSRDPVGKYCYAIDFPKSIHPALSPGADLDALNRVSLQNVSVFLNTLASQTPKVVNLYEWTRDEIALATSDAIYGPKNPFRDPKLLDEFWRFEPGLVILLLGIFPSILAKESLRAREKIVAAFQKYFGEKGHEQGSALIRARYQYSFDYGVSLEDVSRFEVGGAVAIMTNTIPAAFWVLWHIISDSHALKECQTQLDHLCKVDNDSVTIDVTDVKHSCPLLISTLQESLRFHGSGTSVRVVQEDHMLNGEYLLKKGCTVMIPGPVQHTLKEIYGDTTAEFRHDRFVKSGGKPLNPAGFRGFGGGATLCPGRHFASTEIIAFVALMLLRFDITPVGGKWIRPTTEKGSMASTIPGPDTDIKVEIRLREGQPANKQWNAVLKGSDKAIALLIEDVDKN